jgi:hypothetical protein
MFVLTVGMVVLTSSVAIAVIIMGSRSPKLSTYDTPTAPRSSGERTAETGDTSTGLALGGSPGQPGPGRK